jgi:hypothetical protein
METSRVIGGWYLRITTTIRKKSAKVTTEPINEEVKGRKQASIKNTTTGNIPDMGIRSGYILLFVFIKFLINT